MVKRKTTLKNKKPIGFVKSKGKYQLVFGSVKNPTLKGSYKTKKSLKTAAQKFFKTKK